MILGLPDGLQLTDFEERDILDLVQHLANRAIYQWTLRVPHPYEEHHARQWLDFVAESRRQHPHRLNHGIRLPNGRLIGGIGLEPGTGLAAHRAELGYWLAESHWNRGIATAVVGVVANYARDVLKLRKLTAVVFVGNDASCRVLAKNGFQQEGYLRQHYLKDGQLIDAIALGKVLSP